MKLYIKYDQETNEIVEYSNFKLKEEEGKGILEREIGGSISNKELSLTEENDELILSITELPKEPTDIEKLRQENIQLKLAIAEQTEKALQDKLELQLAIAELLEGGTV